MFRWLKNKKSPKKRAAPQIAQIEDSGVAGDFLPGKAVVPEVSDMGTIAPLEGDVLSPVLTLCCINGEHKGRQWTLRDLDGIGRQSCNAIVLSSPYISRYHLCFRLIDGQWFVRDIGGYRMVKRNDQFLEMKAEGYPLKHNDVLSLCDREVFVVQITEPSE